MSITRIGESQAREGKVEELREFLISILPIIRSSEGSESADLYQNRGDASKFVIVEKWESLELHQASVKDIPPEKLAEIRPLLAAAPSGGYYELVSEK